MKTVRPSPLLSVALTADAGASGLIAALQLSAARPLADALALPQALLVETGAFLVLSMLLVGALALGRRVVPALVRGVIAGNLIWAAGCIVLPAVGALQPGALGVAYLALQAVAVLLFAGLQALGLARATAGTASGAPSDGLPPDAAPESR